MTNAVNNAFAELPEENQIHIICYLMYANDSGTLESVCDQVAPEKHEKFASAISKKLDLKKPATLPPFKKWVVGTSQTLKEDSEISKALRAQIRIMTCESERGSWIG